MLDGIARLVSEIGMTAFLSITAIGGLGLALMAGVILTKAKSWLPAIAVVVTLGCGGYWYNHNVKIVKAASAKIAGDARQAFLIQGKAEAKRAINYSLGWALLQGALFGFSQWRARQPGD